MYRPLVAPSLARSLARTSASTSARTSASRIHTRLAARTYSDKSDDRMIGPYPKVKFEYYNERPQDIKYDDQQGRRNLGEPLHHQFDLIDVWSPDHFSQRTDATAAYYNLYFIGILAAFSGWCYYVFDGPNFVRREYPGGLNKALGGTEQSGDEFKAREDKSYGA